MTTERSDGERALRSWFHDGPTVMPDRVIDVIADRIAREQQRSRWRLRGRPFMTTPIKLVAGLAAVLAVAVVTWQFLPGSGGVGGEPTPKSSLVAPSPTASEIPSMPDGRLEGGTYRLRPLPQSAPNLTIDAAVPEGWHGFGSWAITGPSASEQAGPDGVAVAFVATEGLRSDPCHWDLDGTGRLEQPGDVAVGPTVDDLVAALIANPSYESSTPMPVTLDGFAGQRLDLELPTDHIACDREADTIERRYLVFTGDEGGGFTAMADAPHSQLSIVDVDGARLIVVLMSHPGTSGEDLSAAQGILDSLVITP